MKFTYVYIHGFQRMNPADFYDPADFSFSATMMFTVVVVSKMP